MEYKVDNKSIVISKSEVENTLFLHAIGLGVAKQFTYTIDSPRILIFDEKNLLKKLYKNLTKIGIEIERTFDKNFFGEKVHFCEFDFGLMLSCFENDVIVLNFFSGSGEIISQTKFSIIEKELEKINNFIKNNEKNTKKLEKIKKISIKNEKNNKCTYMQKVLQNEKFYNFNENFLIDF